MVRTGDLAFASNSDKLKEPELSEESYTRSVAISNANRSLPRTNPSDHLG